MSEEHIPYEQLIGYATGELNERESAVVMAHLPNCATCAGTIARFKRVREFLRNDDTVEPAPAIIARAQALFHPLPYEQLIDYAAKELDASESAVVTAHLATCAECAATVARFRAVRQLVRGDFSMDPSRATITRVQAIIHSHGTESRLNYTRISWLQFLFPKVRPLVAASLAVLLFALLLLLGQTSISTADTAIPGDALYPVKLDAEGLQIALSPDQVRKAQLLLGLTQKRADEMTVLNANGRDDYIPETATRYESVTNQVMEIVSHLAEVGDSRAPGLGALADAVLSRNIGVLTNLLDKVTEQVRSAIAHAVSVSENDRSAILNAVVTMKNTPTPTPTPTLTWAPVRVSTPTLLKLPASQTPVPAGQTPIPPSQPSQPRVPPSPTNVQPVATPVPPSPTNVPPSATPVSPSPTNMPLGQTKTPPGQQTKIARTPTPTP